MFFWNCWVLAYARKTATETLTWQLTIATFIKLEILQGILCNSFGLSYVYVWPPEIVITLLF